MFTFLFADVVKSFDTVDRGILGLCPYLVLGFLAGFVMLILSTMLMFV